MDLGKGLARPYRAISSSAIYIYVYICIYIYTYTYIERERVESTHSIAINEYYNSGLCGLLVKSLYYYYYYYNSFHHAATH